MATKTFKIGLSNTDKQNMAQDVYERVLDLTFAEYDSSNTYNTGDFVVYNDALYQCKEDSVTGTWDSSKWESATLQDLLDDVEGAVASISGKANTIDLINGTLVPAKALAAEQIENVSDETGSTQTSPFVLQATGTDNNTTATPTAPVAKHLELRGNSVAWNQTFTKVSTTTFNTNSTYGTLSKNGEILVYTVVSGTTGSNAQIYNNPISGLLPIAGHKYLISVYAKCSSGSPVVRIDKTNENHTLTTSWQQIGGIITYNNTSQYLYFIQNTSSLNANDTIEYKDIMVIDLTQLGKEYETILAFKRDYPLPYYESNVGTLKNGESKQLITIGCNQFDGEWEIGNVGQGNQNVTNCSSKNYIKVIGGETYAFDSGSLSSAESNARYVLQYDANKTLLFSASSLGNLSQQVRTITLEPNTRYVKLVYYINNYNFTNNFPTDTMFRLYWDEAHDYVDYDKHVYDLPTLDEPLRSAGSVCDILSADGTLVRNIGVVDLGTLSWTYQSGETYPRFLSTGINSLAKPTTDNNTVGNIICSKYESTHLTNITTNGKNLVIAINNAGNISIRDTSYTDAATFKTAMSGVYLYYELATPTTTQDPSKAFAENIVVDDFGTMKFVPVDGATEPIIPQGNKFFYPADYVLFIDDMYNRSKDGGEDADANNFVVKSEMQSVDTQLFNAIGGTLRQCLCVKESLSFENTNVIDLGTLNWQSTTNDRFSSDTPTINPAYSGSTSTPSKILCSKYKTVDLVSSSTTDLIISLTSDGKFLIRDLTMSSYTTAQVKSAMKGVLVAYEKAS